MRALFLISTLVAFACGAATGASAQDAEHLTETDPGPEARARFQLGQALYQEGKFVEAAAEFDRAYAASDHPAMLFNAFVCYRDAGELGSAVERLRQYLEAGAAEGDEHTRLTRSLELLERRLAAEEERETEAAETAAPGAEQERGSSSPPHATPRDDGERGGAPVAPIVLLAAGGAMMAGGVVTGILVIGKDGELADACPGGVCKTDPSDDVDSGRTLALVTDVLLFGGAAVAAVGLVWLLTAGGDDAGEVQAGAACDGRACAAAVRGRW